ncbi:S8 family serine peptidase [Nocardioides dongxiaopingii]|nr:S8 family serine peptidase [Nocardioides sp. S-1144]
MDGSTTRRRRGQGDDVTHRRRRRHTAGRTAALCGALLATLLVRPDGAATAAEAPAGPAPEAVLHLVTLQPDADQDDVLASLDLPDPVYRWHTALNGFAVRLDAAGAAELDALPDVVSVEADEVRAMTSAPALPPSGRFGDGPATGGSGVVIGLVDSGLEPDSPLFAQRSSARRPADFDGDCAVAGDWVAAECNGKVVAARWYVDGFGTDRLRAASTLSPRDSDGHGTQMASVAAGNPGVPVEVGGERLGEFGGMAPDASLAVYKACWSAPDPADDGCSTADVVTAVDDATRDGVDVLSLAVGGTGVLDTVERALLGATEAGVVVVAAAGNDGAGATAHASPWVTTVGGTTGEARRGRVLLPGVGAVGGAMLARTTVGPARVVRAVDVAAPGARRSEARYCTPGSLDAARVGGAVVVCDRGRVGRVDKSRAVALADGVAMVLLNRRAGSVDADVHSVPTVHLPVRHAGTLLRWLRTHPAGRVTLTSGGVVERRVRVAEFSASGAGSGVLKPDVVAPGTGVLTAVPGGEGWTFTTGTSVATAHTAGVAATLLGDGLRPAVVRSALVTSARPVPGTPVLRSGAGLVQPDRARRPGLAYLVPPQAYRSWLDGRRTDLNTPTLVLADGDRAARRTITNVTGRRLYFSSSARGFRRDVSVRPAAVRLGPGESVTFRVRVSGPGRSRLDDGVVVWRGASGTVTRLPVVITR